MSAEPPAPPPAKIRTLILVGGHGYDEKAFPKLFEGNPDIEFTTVALKDDSEPFEDIADWKHDVIVLYNMTQRISPKRQENLLKLLDRGVGVVVMHHALASYQDWPEYERIAGWKYHLKPWEAGGVKHPRSDYKHDVEIKVRVEDPNHPITKGVSDFALRDETYRYQSYAPDSHLLLSTDAPTSDRPLAWARTYRKARVFGIQLGHDKVMYTNESCRRIMAQAIRWAAGRLPLGDMKPTMPPQPGPPARPPAAAESAAAQPAAPQPPAAVEEGFRLLFNGKDLTGWEGDGIAKKLWLVENGTLIGRSPGIGYNDFLATRETFGDFILRFQVRLLDNKGNSGVQFRSRRVPNNTEVSGYQADIAEGWWGTLYDESRRNRPLARPDPENLKKALRPGDWNDYEVRAVGDRITMTINGLKMVEYVEQDAAIAREGIIATQIHGGGPMEVQFRNIRIRPVK